jgi:hypothetical protein
MAADDQHGHLEETASHAADEDARHFHSDQAEREVCNDWLARDTEHLQAGDVKLWMKLTPESSSASRAGSG